MKIILANGMRAKSVLVSILMLFFFLVSVNAVSAQSFMEKAESEVSLSDELTRILYPDAQGSSAEEYYINPVEITDDLVKLKVEYIYSLLDFIPPALNVESALTDNHNTWIEGKSDEEIEILNNIYEEVILLVTE